MSLRLQKFSPIDREYPIYEIVDESDTPIFDVTRSDDGAYEITFHDASAGRSLELEAFLQLVAEARGHLADEGK